MNVFISLTDPNAVPKTLLFSDAAQTVVIPIYAKGVCSTNTVDGISLGPS